jgi:hypothetical protein
MIDRINRETPSHIHHAGGPNEYLHPHRKSIVSQREIALDYDGLCGRAARLAPPGAGRDPAGRDGWILKPSKPR